MVCEKPVGYGSMSSALPMALHYHRWIIELIRPWLAGDVLEVGFGYGQYTREIAPYVEKLVAVDCSPECVASMRDVPDNVRIVLADITAPAFVEKLGEGTFDSAVCLNVLEHVEDDVTVLHRLLQVLRPSGKLLLLVPAHEVLSGRMDVLAGHYRRYNGKALGRKLIAAGFELVSSQFLNPLGGVGWWLNAKLLRPKDLSDQLINRQILWFDRFVLPISRLLDPLTGRFFGQSLWVVAARPELD